MIAADKYKEGQEVYDIIAESFENADETHVRPPSVLLLPAIRP